MRTALLRTALATAALLSATTPLFANQCDAYGEAPELAALVDAGTLPPVQERLPLNPLVVEPAEQIGMYGGEMVDTYGGQRIGEMRHYGYEPLVRWAVDGSEVVPNVAESWDISEDASTYTFKLREGMKWSDGMPFTSADILFWWERIETNTAINASGPRGIFVVDGEHATVEAIDDYTIRFSWSKPNGVFLLDLASPYGQRVVQFAKHHAEQFDLESNPDGVAEMMADANADDYGAWWKSTVGTYGQNAEYFNPRPHVHAHLPTGPVESRERFTFERNPYYFKVDTACNQLPYIDRRTWVLTTDPEVQLAKSLAGEIDISRVSISTPNNRGVFFENQEPGDYRLINAASADMNVAFFMFPMSHPDRIKAEVYQDRNFRIGLSHAINREELIDVVFLGQGEPFQVAPRPGSPATTTTSWPGNTPSTTRSWRTVFWTRSCPTRTETASACARDGERFQVIVSVNQGFKPDWVDMMLLIERYWEAVGVDTIVDVVSDELHNARRLRARLRHRLVAGRERCRKAAADQSPGVHGRARAPGQLGGVGTLVRRATRPARAVRQQHRARRGSRGAAGETSSGCSPLPSNSR